MSGTRRINETLQSYFARSQSKVINLYSSNEQGYKNSRSRYRLCRLKYCHTFKSASPSNRRRCHPRKSGFNQQPEVTHSGRIHREVSGRKGTEPDRHARRSQSLRRCGLRGHRRTDKLRPGEELLRYQPRGGSHRISEESQSPCDNGHQKHHSRGVYGKRTQKVGYGKCHLLARIPAREQSPVRQPLPQPYHRRPPRRGCPARQGRTRFCSPPAGRGHQRKHRHTIHGTDRSRGRETLCQHLPGLAGLLFQ